MKHLLFFVILSSFIFSSFYVEGQVCVNNPSIQQADINPSPFTGNSGILQFLFFENLLDYTAEETDPVTITICMLNISPQNGASSVFGSFSSTFNWLYDPNSNCLQGTQNQDILGGTGGLIKVDFQVDNTIPCPNNQMGFHATLQPASCMAGINETIDDVTFAYTCSNQNSICINNPSIQQADINPSPLTSNTGIFQFSYVENLLDYTGEEFDPVKVTVCMLNISPQNGAASVSGSFSSTFNWVYDPTSNCLQGTQNQDILGGTGGLISVDFQVDNPVGCPSNQLGFNATIQPPACMAGINETIDDVTSAYTCAVLSPPIKCRGKIRAIKGLGGSYTFSLFSQFNNILSYHWDFGDGNTSTSPNPTHTYTQPGKYTIKLTTINANFEQCSFRRRIGAEFLTTPNGIPVSQLKQDVLETQPELIANDLQLSPNPARNSVNVQFEAQETENATLSIVNITGQTLYKNTIQLNNALNSVDLELTDLTSGVYFITLETKSGLITKKLIKE